MKNAVTEVKSTLDRINSRFIDTEEQISKLEDSGNHWNWTEKRMKRNDSLRDLWDNIKHINICIIGIPEGEERTRGKEHIWRHNSWKLS